MAIIFLTHCSKEKSELARASGEKLPPDQLYTDPDLQAFIQRCKETGSSWAILSDKYGVIFPSEKHDYYEKPPATVTPEEERIIVEDFNLRLGEFQQICFYIRRETYHPFYERVLAASRLTDRIVLIEDLEQIGTNANFL